MKIHIGPRDPKLHDVKPHPPVHASFPDLIAAPDRARAETAGRAAGFQALGMFGVCNATAYQLIHHPRLANPATPAHAASRPDQALQGHSTPQAVTHGGAPTPAATSSPATARAPRPSGAATPHDRSVAAGALFAEVPGDSSGGPTVDPDREPATPRQRWRGQGAASALQTGVRVVASANGTTTVAAIQPGMSAEEAERFRARAASMMREFGLVLDKVAVNGDDRPQVDPWGRGSQSWR